jgi:hypothetical protein
VTSDRLVGIIEPPRRQDAKEEREKGRKINCEQLTGVKISPSIALPGSDKFASDRAIFRGVFLSELSPANFIKT